MSGYRRERRTRAQDALFLKKHYEEIQIRKNSNGGGRKGWGFVESESSNSCEGNGDGIRAGASENFDGGRGVEAREALVRKAKFENRVNIKKGVARKGSVFERRKSVEGNGGSEKLERGGPEEDEEASETVIRKCEFEKRRKIADEASMINESSVVYVDEDGTATVKPQRGGNWWGGFVREGSGEEVECCVENGVEEDIVSSKENLRKGKGKDRIDVENARNGRDRNEVGNKRKGWEEIFSEEEQIELSSSSDDTEEEDEEETESMSTSDSDYNEEEVEEEEEEEEIRREEPHCSIYLEEEEDISCHGDGKEMDMDDVGIAAKVRRRGRPRKAEKASEGVGMKRKRGGDISCSIKGHGDDKFVAQRLRSRFASHSSLKKQKRSLETASSPIRFDLEEDESRSLSEDDDDDVDDDDDDGGGNGNGYVDTKNGTSQRNHDGDGCIKKEKHANELTKKKFGRMSKHERLELLLNTILEKGKDRQKETSHAQDEGEGTDNEERLPLKFNFGREEPMPVEKSEEDILMDKLWADFDLALGSSGIGSAAPSVVDTEDPNEPEIETDPATLCAQGKHVYILDEEIGILCRRCRFVKQEIKNVIPPMDTCRSERSGKKFNVDEADCSMWQGFDFPDGYNSQDFFLRGKGTVWEMIPGIIRQLHPHQQDACEFIWMNLAGGTGIDRLKSFNSDGSRGCVISHAPGTGKTFTTLAAVKPLFQASGDFRVLLVSPKALLPTWEMENRKWSINIPFYNLNSPGLSGKENTFGCKLVRGNTPQEIRLLKLFSWSTDGGIIGCSYNLFEILAGHKLKDKGGKKTRQKLSDKYVVNIRKVLLEMPNLVILDEGHTPRNENSLISKALQNIKTKSRIILSGTPFQNNFDELYNIFQWVRPNFADRISLKTQKNDPREKWNSLTTAVGKDANEENLNKVIDTFNDFVHIYKGDILQQKLPGLRDYMVVLNPSTLQKDLFQRAKKIQKSLDREHEVALVSIHPSLSKGGCSKTEKSPIQNLLSKSFKLDDGVKAQFVIEQIRLSAAMNEKVLVFSQYRRPLHFLKGLLHSRFKWTEGEEVLMIDGTNNMKDRLHSIEMFNNPGSSVKVLLASIKACGEGINLTGASRIVLLDVVWNPSVVKQAISRAYRLGQRKVVYTYHLITSGTMEEDKYRRQNEKYKMSTLVFSSSNRQGEDHNVTSTISEDKILETMVEHDRLRDVFKEVRCIPGKA